MPLTPDEAQQLSTSIGAAIASVLTAAAVASDPPPVAPEVVVVETPATVEVAPELPSPAEQAEATAIVIAAEAEAQARVIEARTEAEVTVMERSHELSLERDAAYSAMAQPEADPLAIVDEVLGTVEDAVAEPDKAPDSVHPWFRDRRRRP